jgi:hypothetical protein
MIADFLLRLLIGSCVCIGVWNAFGKDEIMGWLGNILEKHFPEKVNKPIFMCPPCMASLWGSAVWFYLGGGFWLWPVFVLALSGLNVLVVQNLIHESPDE